MSEHTIRLADGKRFAASSDSTLLDAAIAAGLNLEHGCRTGRCGSCKTRVVQGDTARLNADMCLSAAEHAQGWVLTCTNAAQSDLTLDTQDLAALDGIVARTLPARVHAIKALSQDVVQVLLRLPANAALRFLPGQYVNVIGRGGVRRSYSIANAPSAAGILEFFIRRVEGGAMSNYWFGQAAVGDLLRMDGPRGSFYLRHGAAPDVVLLATGTGIAPMKAMLESLAQQDPKTWPRSVHLIWGGRTTADLFWQPEFAALPLRYTPVLSRADDAWQGARGHVQQVFLQQAFLQQALVQQAPQLEHCDVYACGSPAMIAGARASLLAAGLAATRFHADAFVSST